MKARVSKNLTGTLILPSISTKPFVSKQEFEINYEQYWKDDVQNAIRKKYVLITSGEPKPYKTVEIVKSVNGSVALPLVKKVLRDDAPFKIPAEMLDTAEYKTLLKNNLISVVGRKKKRSIDATEEADDTVSRIETPAKTKHESVVWDAGKKADQDLADEEKAEEKSKKIKRVKKPVKKTKKADNSLIIDTDTDDDVEMADPNEAFIDDETRAKIAAHPILGKKKQTASQSDDVQWVDVDNTKERIRNHPILGKKKSFDL